MTKTLHSSFPILALLCLAAVVVRDVRGADTSGAVRVAINDTSVHALNITSAAPHAQQLGAFDWLTNLPGDWWHWSKANITAEHLPVMGIIAVATAGTFLTDRQVYDALHGQYLKHPWYHDFSDRFTWIGDGKFQFGIAVALGAYGLAWQDDRAIRTASQTVEVILACGAVVQLLKHTTGRESPFTATQPTGRWIFFPNQIEYAKHVPHYDAYPSGHVATALATLTVLAENYPEQTWIRWIGYPAVAGLAMGMVANGIHWWSDYPLSIALGYSFGELISHPVSSVINGPSSGVKTSFYPMPLPDGLGLGFGMWW